MQDFIFNLDLEIKNGDFAVGESDSQHTEHILIANKGEYKAAPELGVGITQMLNSEDATEFLIEAKKNLQYDGQQVNDIRFTEDGKLNVDSNYK
ncbi:oxidase [Chryseobacterium sp. 6424]|uniref:oxidase n=1 Tax=Chryseobacterium sp. 6424 TaxID=2039166 RepID=UPI000EFA75C6|nr:oxidase [Chryseobacterium sp. 6424]AYO58196.1 oxidase [Chryseobacterium sp. 6424]